MDIDKFVDPANWIISGMTGSGKTFWVYTLLKHKHVLFKRPPVKILYCYSVWQSIFEKMEKNLDVVFCKGIPSSKTISEFVNNDGHKLIVFL